MALPQVSVCLSGADLRPHGGGGGGVGAGDFFHIAHTLTLEGVDVPFGVMTFDLLWSLVQNSLIFFIIGEIWIAVPDS